MLGVKTFAPIADYVTINVSSPNTPGLRDLQRRDALDELVARVAASARGEAQPRRPLLVKIAPDLDDARARRHRRSRARAGHRRPDRLQHDDRAAGDAAVARPRRDRRPLGPAAVRAVHPACLARAYLALGGAMALIGCGGVEDAATALAKIEAGASLVQLYTSLALNGVGVIDDILNGLERAVAERGVAGVADLRGARASDWASPS